MAWWLLVVSLVVACTMTTRYEAQKSASGAVGGIVIYGFFLLYIPSVYGIRKYLEPWELRRRCVELGIDQTRLAAFRSAEEEFGRQTREFDEWFGQSQRAFWLSLSPNQFEHEVGRLYRRLRYSALVTRRSRDGGADVILRGEHGTTIVQCKAHQRKIGVKAFRELYGVMADFGAESAILACLRGATDDARRFVQGKPIRVVMLNDLVQMSRELVDDVGGDGGA
jgi:hypothetical protein